LAKRAFAPPPNDGFIAITVAAACGAAQPEPEIKLAIRAGSMVEIEGKPCRAFGIATDNGTRLCTFEEDGGRLYEFITNSGQKFGIAAGRQLSSANSATIRRFAETAKQAMSAEAIDLLLRNAELTERPTVTAWKIEDNGVAWIVAAGRNRLIATTSVDGAVLAQRDGAHVAAVTWAEIEGHAAEAATGQTSLQPSK
jgi:hypothetical protein